MAANTAVIPHIGQGDPSAHARSHGLLSLPSLLGFLPKPATPPLRPKTAQNAYAPPWLTDISLNPRKDARVDRLRDPSGGSKSPSKR